MSRDTAGWYALGFVVWSMLSYFVALGWVL